MSRAINKVSLMGNVGTDPDVRSTANGNQFAKLSLATNRSWKDAAGNKQEKVEWHRLTFWGKLAEVVEQYVHKGDRIYVEGRLEYSETEKDGQKRYWTDIVVHEMVMLGSTGERAPSIGDRNAPYDDSDLPF